MAYLTEKIDKISSLAQGNNSEKTSTVEYSRNPVEYSQPFRKGSHKWIVTTQNVIGSHFLTAFDVKSGTIFLENMDNSQPTEKLLPRLTKDNNYIQALWCPKLLFLFSENAIEIHSTAFSVVKDGTKLDNNAETLLWRVELPSCLHRGFLLSSRTLPWQQSSWKPPTFVCDLQLPRFSIEPCLVMGRKGVFLLTTMWDPCEWLVGKILRGGLGVERCAGALDTPLPPLLRAAAEMVLARGKVAPAKYLYTLSKYPGEGWLVRLGVFGLMPELAALDTLKYNELSGPAALMKILAQILILVTNPQKDSTVMVSNQSLAMSQLEEVCELSASLGLWKVLSFFSVYRGHPQLVVTALSSRRTICEGSLKYILGMKYILPYLLEEDSRFLYKYLKENCYSFDTDLLKRFIIWLSPLSEQLRAVIRDLRNGVNNTYTLRIKQLISTFVRLLSELDKRVPSPGICYKFEPRQDVCADRFVPRRTLSCGLKHWAIAEGGEATVVSADTIVKPELIGRVVSVSCGRHHTLFLTENGVYASGDNSHGQLGLGTSWQLGWGHADAGGGTVRVRGAWSARVTFLSAGQYHNAAIDIDGNLYTWGWGIHGQLGLGDMYDALVPKLVTSLQGKKIVQVGCGACHTVVLASTGEVFAFGASMFGQLGSGAHEKSSLPRRVTGLPANVRAISVGYFHNLAVTVGSELYCWGASPQAVRAADQYSRRTAATPPAENAPADTHLSPMRVDTSNVRGNIVQMSAGWHHSCILTHLGYIYTWGLNFDGQLGSGDRKQIPIPHRVEIPSSLKVDDVAVDAAADLQGAVADPGYVSSGLVGCGGDFTMFVNDHGKIYIVGKTREDVKDEGASNERIIMMTTTKRLIKIPARRANIKHTFHYLGDVCCVVNINLNDEEYMLPLRKNPIARMSDFNRDDWLDEIIHDLRPWIKETDVADDKNLASKLAYYNNNYLECIKLQLDSLKSANNEVEKNTQRIYKGTKSSIEKVVKNRIKEIGLAYLNDKIFPHLPSDIYASLPCSCDESPVENKSGNYYKKPVESTEELALRAGKILDDSLTNFPANYESWNKYLCLIKEFFIENELPGTELEAVLKKYIEKNASLVSSAVLCSEECASYEKLFTPKFYLNVCSKLLDTSG